MSLLLGGEFEQCKKLSNAEFSRAEHKRKGVFGPHSEMGRGP